MSPRTPRARVGFTLIELLTVIAIIGILAAALFPAVSHVLKKAKVAAAKGNLQKIGQAYIAFSTEGGRSRMIDVNSEHAWALKLAQYGGLNKPDVWLISDDPLVQGQQSKTESTPTSIGKEVGGKWVVDTEFRDYPLSWAVANKVPSSAGDETPLVWLRGLKSSGKWSPLSDPPPSPFGEEAGLVLLKGGTIIESNNLADEGGRLQDFTSKGKTSDINKALPPSANILESKQ